MIFSKKLVRLGWELGQSRGILVAPNGRLRPAPVKKLKNFLRACKPNLRRKRRGYGYKCSKAFAASRRVRGISVINLGEGLGDSGYKRMFGIKCC